MQQVIETCSEQWALEDGMKTDTERSSENKGRGFSVDQLNGVRISEILVEKASRRMEAADELVTASLVSGSLE